MEFLEVSVASGPLSCHGPRGTSFSSSLHNRELVQVDSIESRQARRIPSKRFDRGSICSHCKFWSVLELPSINKLSFRACHQSARNSFRPLALPVPSRANDPSVARNKMGTDEVEAANDSATAKPLKKVMVFCDGTWCGQLTGTETNVKLLANAIAGETVKTGKEFVSKGIVGCYFDGEGVQGDLSDYLLDDALGGKIREDCLEAYEFLMEKFEENDGKCEAWLIGLSRGAYTIRCVAGMINNCGLISKKVIIKHLGATPTDSEMKDIIQRGYRHYRDRTTTYMPNSEYMKEWKDHHSRETERPPVKFMGLFETVGALGIPSLNPGLGVDYLGSLNFYGKADEGASAVSGEVERIYQSLAVHDRLTAFTPCHVKRDKFPEDYSYNEDCTAENLRFNYKTEELWFPGAHYDIGRQKFMFYKAPSVLKELKKLPNGREVMKRLVENGVSVVLTRLLRIPDIQPNYEYSAAVVEWMASKMRETDPEFEAFRSLPGEVARKARDVGQTSGAATLLNRVTLKPSPLTTDAYDHLTDNENLTLHFVPFGHRFLVGLMDRYLLQDRLIVDPPPPDPSAPPAPRVPPAPPVRFHPGPPVGRGVDPNAQLKASKDYRSRSYEAYILDQRIMH